MPKLFAKRQDTIMLCCKPDNTTIYSESQAGRGMKFQHTKALALPDFQPFYRAKPGVLSYPLMVLFYSAVLESPQCLRGHHLPAE